MTDTERARIDAICKVANVKDIGDLSDGFHTFNSLYYQRMMLFATIVKQNKDKAWKSLRHEDGELCFGGGWFVVGIDTPEGSYTYHYEDNYFSLFDCEELECGKHWDGHTEKDVTRLLSLPSAEPERKKGKWTTEEVAELLFNILGDDCACNFFGINEWLPERCKYTEIADECPNPKEKHGCWIQFLLQGGADMHQPEGESE